MKTLITLALIILIAITAVSSYLMFSNFNYYSSALLTAVWYLSGSLLITLLGTRKLIVR